MKKMEIRKITSEILDLENFCLGSGAVSINSVSVLSQRHFSTLTSQVSISQMETSQMCNFPNGNFPKVMLGPMRHHRLQWGPSAAARMDWGPTAAARTS